ncbi:hypothetical protein C8J56DRAFT_1007579 [Mycena floridula]|nr:hypothetical protein C8J56DRAFT_1007579 [Mycena floridula]
MGKVTPFDYYTGLQRLTDNTGCIKVLDRYHEFLQIGQEFHHLGNDSIQKISETKAGELGVICPACPSPEVNLLLGWQTAAPEQRFIYTLFLAMDACFCLKQKMVSSDAKDPGLATGWAYFVEDPMNSCTRLSTVDHANTRFSRGYVVTRVGLGLWARHDLVVRNGVGDLQKGEKYGNMTFILATLLRYFCLMLAIVLSYDINCQFYKNLATQVRLNIVLKFFCFAIPKLHIMGHKLSCQWEFNLNFMPGVGRMDGEGVEQPWASIGLVVTSTQEMGPGHWHDWNWCKIVVMGRLFLRRWQEAKEERVVQEESFGDFSLNQDKFLGEWMEKVEVWEADVTQPNPYKQKGSTITLQQVCLWLMTEELVLAGAGMPSIHKISPPEFIIQALEIEEQQHCLKQEVDQLKSEGTTKQTADIVEKHNKITHQITCFQPVQSIYMAASVQLLADKVGAVGKASSHQTCQPKSTQGEGFALLHNQLFIKARLLTYKNLHAQHQGAMTRSHGLLGHNELKMSLTWEAKLSLVEGRVEKVGWQKLEVKDIKCMQDLEETAKQQKSSSSLVLVKLLSANHASVKRPQTSSVTAAL